jgi:hypothetical protein
MDVSIQLAISGGETLILTAVANANVNWSLASNLLSLGCTDLVGDGMTKISTVFLNMIVNRELLPQAKAFINGQINAFTQQQTTQTRSTGHLSSHPSVTQTRRGLCLTRARSNSKAREEMGWVARPFWFLGAVKGNTGK